MSFLSLVLVFLLEQLRPLSYERVFAAPVKSMADFVEARINAGGYLQGVLAWSLLAGLAVLLTLLAYFLLHALHPLLALVFNVAVLYLTMGFRQFSSSYTEIQMALRLGEIERARGLLTAWRGIPADTLGAGDISRLAIEEALVASHRHVFAVLLWFLILPGPAGAVLYRFSSIIAKHWQQSLGDCEFSRFPRQLMFWLEWPAVRLTAAMFAVVGDFEDAIYCWRTQAKQWPDAQLGIVLASGAGALGVRLGVPAEELCGGGEKIELGLGDPADVDFMQSAVGLVWRATVFWMLLLFLLGLASLVS